MKRDSQGHVNIIHLCLQAMACFLHLFLLVIFLRTIFRSRQPDLEEEHVLVDQMIPEPEQKVARGDQEGPHQPHQPRGLVLHQGLGQEQHAVGRVSQEYVLTYCLQTFNNKDFELRAQSTKTLVLSRSH